MCLWHKPVYIFHVRLTGWILFLFLHMRFSICLRQAVLPTSVMFQYFEKNILELHGFYRLQGCTPSFSFLCPFSEERERIELSGGEKQTSEELRFFRFFCGQELFLSFVMKKEWRQTLESTFRDVPATGYTGFNFRQAGPFRVDSSAAASFGKKSLACSIVPL